jgi:hypothetical protein
MQSDDFTNLKVQRSDVDVWQSRRPSWDHRIGLSLATIAGAALAFYGIRRRRSAPKMRWLVGGAVLGCAAASLRTAQWRGAEPSADETMQESVDSFPASDAPSSTATTATAQPLRSDLRLD